MMDAFSHSDLVTACAEQYRSVQLIELLAGFGYMAAAKAVMGFLGVVGSPFFGPPEMGVPSTFIDLLMRWFLRRLPVQTAVTLRADRADVPEGLQLPAVGTHNLGHVPFRLANQ